MPLKAFRMCYHANAKAARAKFMIARKIFSIDELREF
jgi:hypothetical protein